MELSKRKIELEKLLKIDEKRERVKNIESLMGEPKFWEDHETAAKAAQELKHLQDFIDSFESADDEHGLEKLESESYYSGPHDNASVFLAIHAGSGGVEAMDW